MWVGGYWRDACGWEWVHGWRPADASLERNWVSRGGCMCVGVGGCMRGWQRAHMAVCVGAGGSACIAVWVCGVGQTEGRTHGWHAGGREPFTY